MSLLLSGDADTIAAATASDAALRRFLFGLPGVDTFGLERRAAALGARSISGPARTVALDHAISMVDLTTLEGADTPRRVRSLCAQARQPDPSRSDLPSVAAVCVYPDLVGTAVGALAGSGVRVASVATAFPAGRVSLPVKEADTREAIDAGADEIDMVIDRGAFLAGRFGQVLEEIVAIRAVCTRTDGSRAKLKVILETGELPTYDDVRRAAWLALAAGADTVKTSTGKISPAATPSVVLVLLEAVRDFARITGEQRGVKAAGGIRTAAQALHHLTMVHEVAGRGWVHPDRFRFGASSLLDDLVRQRPRGDRDV